MLTAETRRLPRIVAVYSFVKSVQQPTTLFGIDFKDNRLSDTKMRVINTLGPIEPQCDEKPFTVVWFSNNTVGIKVSGHLFTGDSIEIREGEIWLKNDDNPAIWFCYVENHLLRRIDVENNRNVD